MDVDVYVARHRGEWSRLELLVRKGVRPRRLSGDEFDIPGTVLLAKPAAREGSLDDGLELRSVSHPLHDQVSAASHRVQIDVRQITHR